MDHQSLLDEIVNEDSIQILKAALPYLSSQGQSFASVFAKALELQNTLRLFHSPQSNMRICAQSSSKTNPLEMLNACSQACHGPIKEQLDQLINTLVMLQMFEWSQKPLSKDSMEKGGKDSYESQ